MKLPESQLPGEDMARVRIKRGERGEERGEIRGKRGKIRWQKGAAGLRSFCVLSIVLF